MPLPRRALHQPFFPSYVSSPPTQSQPPQPSFPKYPSSSTSSSSTADSPPFFPKYPSPPPPRPSPSLPTFPANISSLITPSRNAPASSKLIPIIALPILALILLSLIAAFFLLRRKQRSSGKGVQPGSDTSRLVPLQATSSSTSAPASSEFLYIGTLVSSRSPTAPPPVDLGPASADSPELRPLPPLSRQSRRSCSSDEEFFSPKGVGSPGGFKPPPPPPPPPAVTAARRPTPPAPAMPRRKLKALHWDKVQASSERAMVWDQLKPSSFHFNEEMMESLFGCDSSNLRRKVAMSTMHVEEYKVLDPKKSQNIAILMRALNVTKEEVCEALLEGNADSLGIELLETLLRMAPSKEEEVILREYKDESPYKLGPAEKFLKAILNIPFAFKRVDALLYIANFESEVNYLNKSFQTLELACEELRSSRLFRKLLDAVLKTGNRMNLGTNRGDAQAFKLDTLLKLVDVKGTDGKTTLLHFVVQEISRAEGFRASAPKSQTHSPKDDLEYKRFGLHVVSGLGAELSNVKKAATMDSEILSNYVSKLAVGIGKIREVARLNESSDRFHQTMISFLRVAEVEITKLQSQENLALALVKETTEYFHGDLAKEEAHPFRIFMIVRDFLVILDQVCKDVVRINERSVVSSVPVSSGFLRVYSMHLGSSDDESNSSLSS